MTFQHRVWGKIKNARTPQYKRQCGQNTEGGILKSINQKLYIIFWWFA